MKDGWLNQTYVVWYDESEIQSMSSAYGIDRFLPGHSLCAILGWDDFVLKTPEGKLVQVPSVPLAEEFKKPFVQAIDIQNLKTDERLTGKMKWYVQPLIFGGDPKPNSSNMIWVDAQTHQKLVVWWNDKYREVKQAGR